MRVKQIVRECDGRIGRLERWARIRLHEEITRDRAAEELGVSPSHLSYLFAHWRGESFSAWLRRLRVEEAERLLAAGRLNVGEVADACGFGSMRTLQRHFKERYGVTPSEYRAWHWHGGGVGPAWPPATTAPS